MFSKIRNNFRNALLERWGIRMQREYGRSCFSQEGEDVLLLRFMDKRVGTGVFVDVGANHPFRMSNTALLYEKGWRGIAIDPNPDFKEEFKECRPEDIFVNCGVGNAGSLTYFQFAEPLYNTFNQDSAHQVNEKFSVLVRETSVQIRPLSEILNDHWPEGKHIDFLSADCEGMDLEVMKTHDFDKYPVDFICIELAGLRIDSCLSDPAITFLESKNFVPIAKLCKSALLVTPNAASRFDIEI